MVHISIFWKGTAPSYLFCESSVCCDLCALYKLSNTKQLFSGILVSAAQ